MSNKDNFNSPYSHFYNSATAKENIDAKENVIEKDPFNKNTSINSASSLSNANPYQSYYSDKNNSKNKDAEKVSNLRPFPRVNPAQPASRNILSHSALDVKELFIDKVRNDINLVPTELREGVKTVNRFFVFSSFLYPMVIIFYFTRDYPSITVLSKKRLMIASTIYFGFYFFCNQYFNSNYEKAYNNLRSKYSAEEIQRIIEDYHSVNSVQETFVEYNEESNKSRH